VPNYVGLVVNDRYVIKYIKLSSVAYLFFFTEKSGKVLLLGTGVSCVTCRQLYI